MYAEQVDVQLSESASDDELRTRVMAVLSDRMIPRRAQQVEEALRAGRVVELLPVITPADTFYLTAEYQRRYPGKIGAWGSATQELQDLQMLAGLGHDRIVGRHH